MIEVSLKTVNMVMNTVMLMNIDGLRNAHGAQGRRVLAVTGVC